MAMTSHARLVQQSTYSKYIGAFTANTKKSKAEDQCTIADYNARLKLLETYWEKFSENHFILVIEEESLKDNRYFKENDYESTAENYLQSKSWHEDKLDKLRAGATRASAGLAFPHPPASPPGFNLNQSLEHVKLLSFTGKNREWQSYRDKFVALVINDSSTIPIIKFHRLLNSLEGEPLELLREISITGENFLTAWQTLKARYDDKILRFNIQMNALVNLPSSKVESASHLSSLANTANTCINVFKSLDLPVQHWDQVFVYFIESKMASITRLDWAKEKEDQSDAFSTSKDLLAFLQKRIRTLDRLNPEPGASSGSTSDSSKGKQTKSNKTNSKADGRSNEITASHLSVRGDGGSKPPPKCVICSETHYLKRCSKFSEMPVAERRQLVARQRLCYNCLGGHMVERCPSSFRCSVCQGKHHTMLHYERSNNKTEQQGCYSTAGNGNSGEMSAQQPSRPEQTVTALTTGGYTKLMTTAIVLIESPSGSVYEARALIDSCSEESYLAEHVVQALDLSKQPAYVAISGVGGGPASISKSRVKFTLKSKSDHTFSQQVTALTLKRLTTLLPLHPVKLEAWDFLNGLQLADPHCGSPKRIDCLLGVNIFASILRPGLVSGPANSPSALSTVFGWIIMGGTQIDQDVSTTTTQNFHISVDRELSQALTRSWEIEEPQSSPRFSLADKECNEFFQKTVRRDSTGRFVVRLPFKETPQLPGSRRIATAHLTRMEKRFVRQPELHASYSKFMMEYEQLNHMELVPKEEEAKEAAYYIPHHPVLKGGDCNKIRVVFNAAAEAENGQKLNEALHSGPNLLLDVRLLIIQWRFFRLGFTCDIVKMFRQFKVDLKDQDWQRIVWRMSLDEPVRIYRLTTVTYGTVSAPFLANACMMELARQEDTTYPLAAEVIRKNRYADDFFVGADSSDELRNKADQLVGAMGTAGMTVGKWASNYPPLLPEVDRTPASVDINLDTEQSVSTLGLQWNPVEDFFHFKVATKGTDPTKRGILSQIARIFDPLGYLAPFIVRGKMIFQALWLAGVDWDAPVSTSIKQDFINWRDEIPVLEQIRVPRWLQTNSEATWELHGFCDASERAYAAAVYVVVNHGQAREAILLCAKSKISPLKVLNIPRLELSGALMLAQLINFISLELPSKPTGIFCWSDSEIVLAWLRGHPARWKTFVANRVSEILSLVPEAVWYHVPSADNAADCASRGLTAQELKDFRLWLQGPPWLLDGPTAWPTQPSKESTTEQEARKVASLVAVPRDISSWLTRLQQHSSYHKITRILAYAARFLDNARKSHDTRRFTTLSAHEIERGRALLWRLVQRSHFYEDIEKLQRDGQVGASSSLRRLDPFIDPGGLIRVGGRLTNSALTYAECHPIILPSKDYFVTLLVRDIHRLTMHGGPLVVQSAICRQYWILHGRNLIRGVVRACVTCTRQAGRTIQQKMGPLPALQTRPTRPFTCTGVDYAGPFWIRSSGGRGVSCYKGYVAVFVCMVTKAAHIEVVGDYTTATFLSALRRFVWRRGVCQILCSDHGTNFEGAEAELQRLFHETSAYGLYLLELQISGASGRRPSNHSRGTCTESWAPNG